MHETLWRCGTWVTDEAKCWSAKIKSISMMSRVLTKQQIQWWPATFWQENYFAIFSIMFTVITMAKHSGSKLFNAETCLSPFLRRWYIDQSLPLLLSFSWSSRWPLCVGLSGSWSWKFQSLSSSWMKHSNIFPGITLKVFFNFFFPIYCISSSDGFVSLEQVTSV